MSQLPAVRVDPFLSALRYVTEPYARGAATLVLGLDAAVAGEAQVQSYSFDVFQTRFEIQGPDIEASYVLSLRADQGDGPATIEIDYRGTNASGTASLLVPAGALAGASFAVPVPRTAGLAYLSKLRERPAPAPGQPAGPDKWALTALLGNAARLLWLLLADYQVVAATARDVAAQRHLLTARGASLDHIGEALGVPRLLPAPYRLDLDPQTLALYHLDDLVAPVLDATHDYPGFNHGATRGVPGKFGGSCQITAAGGITIPDAAAFAIEAQDSFTVELFVRLGAAALTQRAVLASKRPHLDSNASSGWLLALLGTPSGKANVSFSLTDRAGTVVEAVTANPLTLPETWFHVAGVVDRGGKQVLAYLNGQVVATAALGTLGVVANCADIGLGADRLGTAQMAGMIDEVRFSRTARPDFAAILAANAQPYAVDAATIALYHLDETDDWIDEDRGIHYALNHGATRGVPARFDAGLRFFGDPPPKAECPSEREFQRRLRTGAWDRSQGAARLTVGPYARYGYRQGAIALPGLTNQPQPVLVNDENGIDPSVRGLVTTACAGFRPTDLATTLKAFQDAGRTPQEAIDYFGAWSGQPAAWFTQQYQAQNIKAPHESCLPKPGAPTYVLIPGAADLALDATASFTVEAIIKPDPLAEDYPRAIAASRSTGLRDGEGNANEAGWGLTLGSYHGVPNNLRWTVGDATGKLVTVYADFGVGDGAYHHVAGVLDRDAGAALLFIDGVEVGQAALAGLGAAATAGDVILGNSPTHDAPYAGLIDEVRLSQQARRTFHPVLGESDDRYRQRLAIYRPFRLPNFPTVRRGVRALSLAAVTAGAVATQAAQLLLTDGPLPDVGQLDALESDSARFCATRQLRVLPARLRPGQSIAADGTTPAVERVAARPAAFHAEALLRLGDTAGLQFPTEGGRWMVLATAQALEQLAARLLGLVAKASLAVQRAWDAQGDGLHTVGRAADVTLTSPDPRLDLGVLGALAHATGIAFVRYDLSGTAPVIRLAVAPGPDLDLAGPNVAPLGQAITLTMPRPVLKNPLLLTWLVERCGPGDGVLQPTTGSNNTSMQFVGTALGAILIVVRYVLGDGTVLRGARRLTVVPPTLDGCDVLAADGRADVAEADVCAPDDDFREAYLIRSADPRVDYASEAARRMQLPLETALLQLAVLAAAEPGAPRVNVLAAYDAAAVTLQRVGRGLVVAPSAANLSAARLGALAFLAGFGYIERRRYPPAVYLSVPKGERFQIVLGPLQQLWANARISGQGELEAQEFDAAGLPDANFNGGMLQPFTNPGVTFAAGVGNAVQPSLAAALTALVAALKADALADPVQILAAFDPKATGLRAVGRAVLLRHPKVAADRLAVYALQAGFGFVQHRTNTAGGPAVYAAAYASGGGPLPGLFGADDVILNALTEVRIRPELPVAGQLDWCLTPCCPGAAVLATALRAPDQPAGETRKVLRGTAAGGLRLTALFSLGDAAEPYQFLLLPRDPKTEPRLTKEQYDDLLNFLDAVHPLGVAAVTRNLRRLVHGFRRPLRWDNLPTRQTYPRYRRDHS